MLLDACQRRDTVTVRKWLSKAKGNQIKDVCVVALYLLSCAVRLFDGTNIARTWHLYFLVLIGNPCITSCCL